MGILGVGRRHALLDHPRIDVQSSDAGAVVAESPKAHWFNPDLANGATVGNVSNESPVVVAPRVGDVLSGNAVASGNDVAAPVASGNSVSAPVSAPVTAPVASGNDTSVAIGSANGNSASVDLGSILGR